MPLLKRTVKTLKDCPGRRKEIKKVSSVHALIFLKIIIIKSFMKVANDSEAGHVA